MRPLRKERAGPRADPAAASAAMDSTVPSVYPPLPPTPAQLYAKALYDPRPTTTPSSEHRLAYALGYPADWRVERRVKTVVVMRSETEEGEAKIKPEGKESELVPKESSPEVEEKRDAVEDDVNVDPGDRNDEQPKPPLALLPPPSHKTASISRTKTIILDRIHATSKNGRKFLWFSHAHALAAAAYLAQLQVENKSIQHLPATFQSQLLPPEPRFNKGDAVQVLYKEEDEGNRIDETEEIASGKTKKKRRKLQEDKDVGKEGESKNKDSKGKNRKSGKKKEPQWYSAIITKRRRVGDEYVYSVFYPEDESTQSDVEDELLQPSEDPAITARNLGFPDGWTATKLPPNRYRLTTPDGFIYTSLSAAKKYVKNLDRKTNSVSRPKKKKSPTKKRTKDENDDDLNMEIMTSEEEQLLLMQQQHIDLEQQDDPPWRTDGHPLLGRHIRWSQEHQVSARRIINVEQDGVIVGFISKTDKDRQGDPGFTNSKGEPADLFHVVFTTQELNHPYAQHLLASQDLELYEVERCLLPEGEEEEGGDDVEDTKSKTDSAEPREQSTTPKEDSAELKKESSEPKRQSTKPRKKNANPKKNSAKLDSESAEPREDSSEPKKQSAKPKKDSQSAGPKKKNAKSQKDTTEPKKESAKPKKKSTKPKEKSAEPKKKSIKLKKDSNSPNNEKVDADEETSTSLNERANMKEESLEPAQSTSKKRKDPELALNEDKPSSSGKAPKREQGNEGNDDDAFSGKEAKRARIEG